MTNWMIVTSADNYERTRKLRFTVQGIKSRHRRKAERMAPGDRVCWYLTGTQGHAVAATSLLPQLRFVKRWPSEHWRLAFQGNVHELEEHDFSVIEDAVIASERSKRVA